MFNFYSTAGLIFGNETSLNSCSQIIDTLGKNIFVISDRGLTELGLIEPTIKKLKKNCNIKIFNDVESDPSKKTLLNAFNDAREFESTGVLGFGGGSSMDVAKLVSLLLGSNQKIETIWGVNNAKGPRLPRVRIPTTAGTGAETEITAMVTYLKEGMKFCMWHPDVRPSLALIDPELTIGLPANLTAWTGVDALIHGIEGYCVPGFNPLCDGAALEGLSLISKSLVTAVEQPDSILARGGMHVGSCLAGISFLKGLGNVHSISHVVGAEYNTHHGLTNAIVLPVVLRFNLPGMEEKVQRMSQAMQYKDHSVDAFIKNMEDLLDRVKIPKSLSELNVPEDSAARIAEKAMKDQAYGQNPKKVSFEEMKEMVLQSIKKAR